tara:strand:- start:129 stop:368 length:240 start_codon:yes stop_codon:yes gene_type:complete
MDIKFVYYFKKNHQVYKNTLTYFQLLDLLELTNKKDPKDQLFSEGHTYQLMQCKNFLLDNKELKIFKCNVIINGELLPI